MASTIKVNNIQNQCGANIANKCGSTITLGASGDTITLACGASQTGFGRTGTVDWDTTPKTANFTAANGTGYFVNTTSGAITMTMPSGSAGAIVSIQDYNKTFDSNPLTITPASGEIINGGDASADLTVTTEGQGLTFIYVDGTVGWKTVHENEFIAGGSTFIEATGGTITTCGNFKIHTFTGPGTFTVTQVSSTTAENTIGYQVVAGGGGGGGGAGGSYAGGGGGAGGFREGRNVPVDNFTASPLVANAPTNAVIVTATSYPITVGAGGAGSACTGCIPGTQGNTSTFSTISSAGGGGGGGSADVGSPGTNGGSGGGGGSWSSGNRPGGSGNTPPVSPPQGNNGGNSSTNDQPASGGGGAGGVGTDSTPGTGNPRPGGAGVSSSISGSSITKAAGGASGNNPGPHPVANGSDNSGDGGQGNHGGNAQPAPRAGGTGGSGVVIIRYKYQ